MGYAWLNIASLSFGVLAWMLPIFAMMAFQKQKNPRGNSMMYGSLCFAVMSLFCVISYRHYLIQMEDWSALMDTTRGFQVASLVMTSVTVAMHILARRCRLKNTTS